MALVIHHQPIQPALSWNLHAWQLSWDGAAKWDPPGTGAASGLVDFPFPDVPDRRKVAFKFRYRTLDTTVWETDDFVRQLWDPTRDEVWTFEQSPRVLFKAPSSGPTFHPGDLLRVSVITKARFRGGRLYAWNPYWTGSPSAFFVETGRDDATWTSTFSVNLADWMVAGFHFKLVGRDARGQDTWEPDSSNRVWRPCDGAALSLKSGQYDVRSVPLALTTAPLQVMVPASLEPLPTLTLTDVVEQESMVVVATALEDLGDGRHFKVATYQPAIYPHSLYTVVANSGEASPITRSFPANPVAPGDPSRFALGASAWLGEPLAQPRLIELEIRPRASSSFDAGLSLQIAIGNAAAYATASAEPFADGTWTATVPVVDGSTSSIRFFPVAGGEPTPYPRIDTGRYFTPTAGVARYFTAEGIFGITSRGPVTLADPPSRTALMRAAFGAAIVQSGVFAAGEMPHGATRMDANEYFVVHAPHAAWAGLVLATPDRTGTLVRQVFPMTVTPDGRYWWCAVPVATAGAGAPYHFLLNDDLEVLDPAAREVQDRGSFDVPFGADPNDGTTAWSLVADVDAAYDAAHAQPWQTMGWQNLVVYEMHAERFTGLAPGGRLPLDVLVDELNATSRLGLPGYLRGLPVTAFELLPIQEFNSALSWGYDPSFYFAVDGHYGGNMAFARFVNAAHANGRAVLLDVVYNHSLGSSLMKIAPDVYRNGDYDGDRMNCGHPMVLEFLRQATLHFCRTFGVDGFRFDDTNTIVTKCTGGWAFLQAMRSAVRTAATASGSAWPYLVAENSATVPWDISNPQTGVMDGQWGIDESYRIRDASYDSWTPGSDHAPGVAEEMNNPSYWGRPFYQAVRFGESHDMVSAQDAGNKRIAARPPFGQGLQMAKALGTLTILSNGVPMLFMGQEYGETTPFLFDSSAPPLDPQNKVGAAAPVDNARVFAWFRSILGLRNDPAQGLQGDANYQVVGTGQRTLAFTCGSAQRIFAVVTFGTANQQQDSSWLGLPPGSFYEEIFNSSWPVFAVEFEPERTNGGYDARIASGQILQLPYIGAVVLQRV